jgi:competence protein ComEC
MKVTRFILLCLIFYLVFLVYYEVKHATEILNNERYLSVKVFDVGQGDSILITTPNKKRILIDGGPNYEIDAYLQEEMPFEPCHLEMVVLTHPHSDHMRGLNRVLQRCSVEVVLFNDIEYSSLLYDEWRELLISSDIQQVRGAVVGDQVMVDGVIFSVLWPTAKYLSSSYANVNNTSIVLFMDFGEYEGLFLGDAETDSLSRIDIAQIMPYIDGDFELLKASHHGAINGLYEPLLSKLMPKTVAIGVGAGNKYGHPHHQTIKFFESIGSKIYRTDLDSTVEIKFPVVE